MSEEKTSHHKTTLNDRLDALSEKYPWGFFLGLLTIAITLFLFAVPPLLILLFNLSKSIGSLYIEYLDWIGFSLEFLKDDSH